jgi:DNA adenine methylase
MTIHLERESFMNSRLVSPVKYHGGKTYMSSKLIPLMPDHRHYVETHGGGLSILLAKDPIGVSEVVNDIYGHLMAFWSVLQNEALFQRFKRLCEATPFSSEQWKQSQKQLSNDDPVVAAHAFLVQNRLSRQGLHKDFATLSRNRVRRGMNEQVSSWLTAIDGLQEVHERLKRVVILNRDALDVIQQQDGEHTLLYVDPPYVSATRVAKAAYAHEMSDQDHHRLVDAILMCSGKVMLSGYPNAIYQRLEAAGWDTFDFHVTKSSSSQATKPKAVERVWANFKLDRDAC